MITVTGHTDAEGKLIFDRPDFELPENARFTIVVAPAEPNGHPDESPEAVAEPAADTDDDAYVFRWEDFHFEEAQEALKDCKVSLSQAVIDDRDERF